MQQKRNHHGRIERRLAEPTHIAAHDRLEIQALPHQPNDKPRDVVLGHEVPHIRRQKQRLVDIPGAKVLAHSPSLNRTRWHLNSDYSDKLLADRNEVLLPDRQSAELGAAARRDNPAAVTQLPLEFVDDTLGFNPEWIVDRIAPRPVLFITTDDDRLVPPQESEAMFARAGEPKKLVILKGFGHYEVYGGEAFRQVMDETAAWYKTHLPAR